MGIIDFRVRPFYKHYREGFPEEVVERFVHAFGYEVTGALKHRSMESLLEEMRENQIHQAIVPGRIAAGTTNEELLELTGISDKFTIFPFLDLTDPQGALEDIDTYILNGPGKGASIEPLVGNDVRFDDERTFPVYKKLEENHIPVIATVSGIVGPYIDNTIPRQIDILLTEFPKLIFVAAHAGWPWIGEFVTLGFKHPNLYLTADFEGTRGAGASVLREAALYMLQDQIIFASSFPLGPIGQGIRSVKAWNLPKEIEDKILYENAKNILFNRNKG